MFVVDKLEKVFITVELPRHEANTFNALLSNGELTKLGIKDITLVSYIDTVTAKKIAIANDTKKYEEDLHIQDKKLTGKINRIKKMLSKNVKEAIQELEDVISSNSESFDDFILVAERYRRISHGYINNIIDFETSDREISKISRTILFIVSNLTQKDLI